MSEVFTIDLILYDLPTYTLLLIYEINCLSSCLPYNMEAVVVFEMLYYYVTSKVQIKKLF